MPRFAFRLFQVVVPEVRFVALLHTPPSLPTYRTLPVPLKANACVSTCSPVPLLVDETSVQVLPPSVERISVSTEAAPPAKTVLPVVSAGSTAITKSKKHCELQKDGVPDNCVQGVVPPLVVLMTPSSFDEVVVLSAIAA